MVFESRSIKFKINAKDHNPPHVHVEGLGCTVRINLSTFRAMDRTDFSKSSLKLIIEEVKNRHEELMAQWSDYHD